MQNRVYEIKSIFPCSFVIVPSVSTDVRPLQRPGVGPHSGANWGILTLRNFLLHPTLFSQQDLKAKGRGNKIPSKMGQTARNLRPCGYGDFVHLCDQDFSPAPRALWARR
jgi:hypothetical protein